MKERGRKRELKEEKKYRRVVIRPTKGVASSSHHKGIMFFSQFLQQSTAVPEYHQHLYISLQTKKEKEK